MADLISMHGLVAGKAGGAGLEGPAAARGVRRDASVAPAPSPAAELALNRADQPAPEVPAGEVRTRQEAITRLDARAETLARAAEALAAVREALPEAVGGLVDTVTGMAERREDVGPQLARLLAGIEPSAAAAVDPGLIGAAETETENALAAARGAAAAERRSLSTGLVAAENATASRVDAERLDRAAEMILRQEAEGQPSDLLAALRGPAISRARVVELLAPGGA